MEWDDEEAEEAMTGDDCSTRGQYNIKSIGVAKSQEQNQRRWGLRRHEKRESQTYRYWTGVLHLLSDARGS